MQRKLSLVLAMLMILSVVYVPTAMAAEVSAISITENQCYYIGEDREAEALKVSGELADGTSVNLTGDSGITYESSDDSVFRFEGNKLFSTGKNGKAMIKATYGENSASILMIRTDFANQPDLSKYETSGEPGTAQGGHYDGTSADTLDPDVTAYWQCRISLEGTNWFGDGYRSLGGWFYDDLSVSKDSGLRKGFSVRIIDRIDKHPDFVSDYGYTPELAEKWKDMQCVSFDGTVYSKATDISSDLWYQSNPDTWGIINKAWSFKKRTKGWHNIFFSLEKNPEAEYGWTLYFYMDGELTGQKDIVPQTNLDSNNAYLTLMCNYDAAKKVSHYTDDYIAAGALDSADTATAPIVAELSVSGIAMEGQTLTANALIADAEKDELDTPEYKWQSSADGSVWTDVPGAVSKEYKLTAGDVGKLFRVAVTPKSTAEPKTGAEKISKATNAVAKAQEPPTAKDVAINGKPETGSTLSVSYTYVPSKDNVEEGDSTFVWEISDTENGDFREVQNSASKEYTLKSTEADKYIRVKVVPTDKLGIPGAAVVSSAVKITAWKPPVSETTYYVAANGSDENPGTVDAPFATIEKARDVISGLTVPDGGVTVYIRGGSYQITDTIQFGTNNSGTAENPITYAAYPGEDVSFVGGKILDTSKIKKVTDETLLNRLVDENAKNHLCSIDLGEQGVKMTPIQSFGWAQPAYNPSMVYMNNVPLTDARWPNDDQSMNLIQGFPVTENGFNDRNQQIKLSLIGNNDKGETVDSDPTDRTKKWHIKSGDAYIGGAIPYFWANVSLRIDAFNTETKTVTSIEPCVYNLTSGWGSQNKLYFGNIFEEIDRPGESYVDREKNILYFYPVGDTAGSNMVVSTLNRSMVTINDASYINFKNIAFKETRITPVTVTNSRNIIFDGNEFSGSSNSALELIGSESCEILNSHFYNIANTAISVKNSGDRKTLRSGNILIENNYFHNCNLIPTSTLFAVSLENTVGVKIRHNEFDDLKAAAVRNDSSNNTLIEYNKVSNSLYFSSDMGSIYWGRDNTVLGTVVRYNYFTNFATDCWALQEGCVDAVFWDDGATGPDLYGNVFYNAGCEYSQVRTNGGEVSNVHGNVFINDTEPLRYAAYLWGWGPRWYAYKDTDNSTVSVDQKIPACNWLYIFNMRDLMGKTEGSTNRAEGNSNTWYDFKKDLLWSSEWKEAYKDTLWNDTLNLYSKELYDGAKNFYDSKDEYGLLKFINENLPKKINNVAHNNVTVGTTRFTDISYGGTSHDNYAQTNVNTAKSLFKDYGKDFTLTDEGLRTVQASAPEFEQIPFGEMGRTTNAWGHKPSVTVKSDIVSGILSAGNEISASYDFTDADGDKEGLTQVYWYVADKKNGEYTMIEGKAGKTLELTDEYAGRYIKYKVIPYDTNTMRGETVMSEPVKVREASSIDLTSLNAAMKAAREALEGAAVGTGAGQYPQAAYDELAAALSEAQTAANDPELTQYAANNAATKLEAAVAKFEKQKIPAIDMDKIVHMNINPLLADTENWDNPGGNMKFENGSMVIDAANFDLATYKAAKYLNHEISFKVKFEPSDESGWVGIYFRQPATNKKVWESGGGGLMYDIKKDIMNIQQHDGGKIADAMVDTVANNFLSFGEEHIVTLGVYDTDEKNKVFWQLKVDGNVVYEKSTEIRDLYGKEGYFGFSSGKGKLTISPTEADKTKLAEKIANAENMTFVAGNGYGEYPKDKVDAFNKAVADAKATHAKADITQYDADKAIENINDAIEALDESVITKETVTADKTIKINSKYPKAEIKAEKSANDVKLETEKSTSLPGIKITAERSIGTVTAEIFEDTKLSGSGTLLAAKELSEPSANIGNAANTVVISMAEGSLTTDKAVRIVLPGQAKKNLGIIVNGKFSRVTKRLSEDSERLANSELKAGETAFIKSGDDYIIWTKVLGEFVTYNTSSSSQEDNNNQPGGGSGKGGTTNNPYGNKGNGGFYSTDTTNPNLDTTVCFNDIQNHWAKADIMAMYRLGVVSGVNDTTFDPDRNITRAEFAALIARALKLSEDAPSVFDDVEKGSWYETSVNACAKAEIITGFDGKFRPNDTITRNEMAVIISNAYSYLGKKGENGGIDKFADKSEIADWAKPSVDVCTTVGLISGMTDTTFEGDKTATRAQAASILKRLLDK